MMMNEVPPFGLDPVKFQKAKRIFCTAAFGILGGFGGVGVAWLVIAALATRMSKEHGNAFIAASIPKLIVGAILGFGLALGFARFLFRKRADAVQEAVEKKYGIGKLYSGIPVFLLTLFMRLLVPWWDRLERKFGIAAPPCLLFGMCAVVLVVSLLVRPRIPRRLLVPLGLLGWMLTLIIACWVGWGLN
jgi:multisubunit Na+/H+ antiporter MnhE subunit